jgi:hypothetical protein
MAKLDARLELRLDKLTLERLERRATAGHLSVAEMVRRAIARELDGDEVPSRQRALERGLALAVPVPADPQELVRELDARYDPGSAAWFGPDRRD